MSKKKPTSTANKALRLSGAGLQMGITIYGCNYLGNWLDTTYNQNFWETGLTLLGVFISIYFVIKQVIEISKDA